VRPLLAGSKIHESMIPWAFIGRGRVSIVVEVGRGRFGWNADTARSRAIRINSMAWRLAKWITAIADASIPVSSGKSGDTRGVLCEQCSHSSGMDCRPLA